MEESFVNRGQHKKEHSGSSRRSHRYNARQARQLRITIAIALLLTLLLFLPLQISAWRAKKDLQARIAWLQNRVVTLEDELTALRTAEKVVTAAIPDNTTNAVGSAAHAPRPATGHQQHRGTITSSRVGRHFTKRELEQLASVTNLMPNGMRRELSADNTISYRLDEQATGLIQGFSLLAGRENRAAADAFELVLQSWHNWPYGHFYLGIAAASRIDMELAADLLLELENQGAATVEAHLYHVFACLMLGSHDEAEMRLLRLLEREISGSKLMLGPLFMPASTPQSVQKALKRIEGLPRIHTAGSLQ